MSLYDAILGHPFVYNTVRPAVVGGIDLAPMYRALAAGPKARVLDVGCGTGVALSYLEGYESYLGVDTDERAVGFAREAFAAEPNARFEARLLVAADVAALAPTHVILGGLLHHLADEDVVALFRLILASPTLERVVTQDIVYLDDAKVNNLLATLDRGQFCRRREHYEALATRAGLHVQDSFVMPASPRSRFVKYLIMVLVGSKDGES